MLPLATPNGPSAARAAAHGNKPDPSMGRLNHWRTRDVNSAATVPSSYISDSCSPAGSLRTFVLLLYLVQNEDCLRGWMLSRSTASAASSLFMKSWYASNRGPRR